VHGVHLCDSYDSRKRRQLFFFIAFTLICDGEGECSLRGRNRNLCTIKWMSDLTRVNTDVSFEQDIKFLTLYSPCTFVQLINSHQQMHQNKFVTDFFIKRFPQYAFRHFYIAIIMTTRHVDMKEGGSTIQQYTQISGTKQHTGPRCQ
jgi:hypothetical protein